MHGDVLQHLISYYKTEDVISGKLRCPTNVPEMASVEISPDYLTKQNFRFPLQTETGIDGIVRYRGEPHGSRYAKTIQGNTNQVSRSDMYNYHPMLQQPGLDHGNRRMVPMPMAIPRSPSVPMGSYATPGSAGSASWFGNSISPVEQSYVRPGSDGQHARPTNGRAARYSPYGVTSPRSNSIPVPHHHQHQDRRTSISHPISSYHRPNQSGPNHHSQGHPATNGNGLSHQSPSPQGPNQPGPGQQGLIRQGFNQTTPSRPSQSQAGASSYQPDVKPALGTDGQLYYPDYSAYDSMSPQHPYAALPVPPLTSASSYQSSGYSGWQPQPQSARTSESVPRQVNSMTPVTEFAQISPGLTLSSTSVPSNPSPPNVFLAPPPLPGTQEWSQQPAVHGWEPEEYPHGSPHYQPHRPLSQQQHHRSTAHQQTPVDPQLYQMPAPAHGWRVGANGMTSS